MRTLCALICGAAVTVYGAAGVWLRSIEGSNPSAEQTICRNLLFCDGGIARQQLHQLLWAGDGEHGANAVALARELLRRSPASAERWCSLGDAYLGSGEIEQARHAYSQAIERGPNSPRILMRAAQFYLALGDTAGYLRQSIRVLSLVPDYDTVVFDSYRRIGASAEQVMREGLARYPAASARYDRYRSAPE